MDDGQNGYLLLLALFTMIAGIAAGFWQLGKLDRAKQGDGDSERTSGHGFARGNHERAVPVEKAENDTHRRAATSVSGP